MTMVFGGFTASTLIDYPGKTACMVYTIGCNFRCPYCHNPELVDEVVEITYPEADILSFLETRRNLLDGVVITGGEPTIHGDELMGFMEQVKERGFLVKLDSNGTDPEFLRTAAERELIDYVAMDIKAPLSTYHKTVGRPVNTNDILTSIDLLRNGTVPYEFRTTVIKTLLSKDDILKILETIKGARAYYLQKFIPTKILNPQFRNKVTYSDEEFEELRELALTYVEHCGIR